MTPGHGLRPARPPAAMIDPLLICADAYASMLAHLRRHLPHEACGLLLGQGGLSGRFAPITNVSAEPQRRYEMEPRALIAAFRDLRASGEEMLGIVHSHPDGPAEPSALDIAQATYPEAVYVIVDLAQPHRPRVRGWRLRPGLAPTEVPLRVV